VAEIDQPQQASSGEASGQQTVHAPGQDTAINAWHGRVHLASLLPDSFSSPSFVGRWRRHTGGGFLPADPSPAGAGTYNRKRGEERGTALANGCQLAASRALSFTPGAAKYFGQTDIHSLFAPA